MLPMIPGYEIDKAVGEGGASTVYRALRSADGCRVALKVLKPEAIEAEGVKFFKAEADVLQSLDHEGLLKVYDFVALDRLAVFVMEYFPGVNLKVGLRKYNDLVQRHRFAIAVALCKTLFYVHSQNVVHRDLKPENVLIDQHGAIKLIDFSLALTKWQSMFKPRKIQGTPQYMAPEQIRKEKVDHRTDIYSLGVTLFEILTGALPFLNKRTDEEWLNAHLRDKPLSPCAVRNTVPPVLDEIILKMLAKNPDNRPQTMQAVVQAIKHIEKRSTARIQRR